jgi:uncharacterized protein (DUF697 family)
LSVTRKNLPKAIQSATGDVRETDHARGARERQVAAAGAPDLVARPVDGASKAESVSTTREAAAPAPQVPPTPPSATSAGTTSAAAEVDATQRRSLAKAIVERHAAYAAVGGIIPVPIVNVAGVTAVIVRMVKVLSGLYGVPFERDRARAVVIGLMGGTVPTGFAAVTTSTLVSLVPISSLIGLAVSSVTAIACTRSIGRIFVEHFEGGATLHDLPAAEKK